MVPSKRSSMSRLRWWRTALLLYATLSGLLAVWLFVGVVGSTDRPIEQSDYLSYHDAATTVLAGTPNCLYVAECQQGAQQDLLEPGTPFDRGLPFNNPPSLALLLAPLGLASFEAGYALFTGVSLSGLGAAVVAATRGMSRHRFVFLTLAMSSWPVITGLLRGQITLLVAASLLAAVLYQRRWIVSGGLIGLATVKFTLLPLIGLWFLVRHGWRAVGVAALVGAGLLLLAALVIGVDAVVDYPAHALGQFQLADAAGIHPRLMINWRAAGAWVGGDGGTAVQWLGTATTLFAIAWVWQRTRADAYVAPAAALIATPLVVPHSNEHEAVLAVIAWLLLLIRPVPRPGWVVPVAVTMHGCLWLGLPLWGEGAARLTFAALIVSLGVVILLVRHQPHSGIATRASGQRTSFGSSGADGG